MHTVHHTDSFILKSTPSGEASRRVWLFTREFGLVVASVQGVRKQGAKLQMQLAEYSFVATDLVRGKDVWRLVTVSEIVAPLLSGKKTALARGYVRTLAAVERFCHGEEINPQLFEHLLECIGTLSGADLDAKSFDTVSLWKVLAALGYISVEEEDRHLYTMPFEEAVRSINIETRSRLIKEINETIKQTHL